MLMLSAFCKNAKNFFISGKTESATALCKRQNAFGNNQLFVDYSFNTQTQAIMFRHCVDRAIRNYESKQRRINPLLF